MNFLNVTNLTDNPLGMLYRNYTMATEEGAIEGLEPCMSFEGFLDNVNEWATETPLTEALCFVDNLLVNFDMYSYLFGGR